MINRINSIQPLFVRLCIGLFVQTVLTDYYQSKVDTGLFFFTGKHTNMVCLRMLKLEEKEEAAEVLGRMSTNWFQNIFLVFIGMSPSRGQQKTNHHYCHIGASIKHSHNWYKCWYFFAEMEGPSGHLASIKEKLWQRCLHYGFQQTLHRWSEK